MSEKKKPMCLICGDNLYILNNKNEREACECVKARRLAAYSPIHYEAAASVGDDFLAEVEKFFAERVPAGTNLLVIKFQQELTVDQVRTIELFWLLRHGMLNFSDLMLFNLIDIHFEQSDLFRNESDLMQRRVCLIKCGWHVMKYDNLPPTTAHFLEEFAVRKVKVLLVAPSSFGIYPEWESVFSEYQYLVRTFGEAQVSVVPGGSGIVKL